MSNPTRSSRRGFNAWLIVTFVVILLSMLFILLHGTGVIRNWGKRGMEQEAEVVLFKSLAKLDQGKMGDMSGGFPNHEAGRVAREAYQFLRVDILEDRELEKALANMPTLLPKDLAEAKANLAVLKQGLLAVDTAKSERDARSGKLLIILRAAGKTSDRIQARYQGTERDFREKDNLYGGPDRVLKLRLKRFKDLIRMHDILLAHPNGWRRTEVDKITFAEPDTKDAMEFGKLQAGIALDEREVLQIRQITSQTVKAEREGMRRRLGL